MDDLEIRRVALDVALALRRGSDDAPTVRDDGPSVLVIAAARSIEAYLRGDVDPNPTETAVRAAYRSVLRDVNLMLSAAERQKLVAKTALARGETALLNDLSESIKKV